MIRQGSELKYLSGLKTWCLDCPLVYGPVPSRRHGLSLGINLLPEDRKACNFDCLYCQCGRSSREFVRDSFWKVDFYSPEEIQRRIADRFRELQVMNVCPDTIVFSGNGEPTLSPSFASACDIVKNFRDQYLPWATIGVLTNGTRTLESAIFRALAKLDWKSIKLDAGALWLDRPMVSYDLEKMIPVWRQIPDLTIQSFFTEGQFDNTQPQVVGPWIDQISRIHPRRVHIYTLDRKPAIRGIQRASLASLTRLARQLATSTDAQIEIFE